MDGFLDGSTDGYAGRIEVLEGRSGRRMRSEAERARIAAESLEGGSGIASRTIASLEYQWDQGRELLGPRDVLVIDEAGMIGTRQMERVLSAAERAGAKVVLVGDPEQLQAIEAGAVKGDRVKRIWDSSGDSRVRPDHRIMDGKTVEGMDTPYTLPGGARMLYPGDTSLGAPASQTVACRCYEALEVDWLRP